MFTVNPELIVLARKKLAKEAADMSALAGGDPAMMGVDPAAQAPAAAGADPAMMGVDPALTGVMPPGMTPAAPPPPPAPAAPATGAAPQQKLKPEQMMQMLDYRLYNMQQQLTAIMNSLGVSVPPESLVLPPGTTGAPPAEAALPGGPMAPPPADAPPPEEQAPGGLPGDVYMGADPAMTGGAVAPIMPPKMAANDWWAKIDKAARAIGTPVDASVGSLPDEPISLQTKASAVAALCRSLNGAR